MATRTKNKSVAKTTRNKNALVGSADSFAKMASAGLETVTADDVIIPRMTILQALSPQIKKRDPEFIKGAEQGDFCDVGTGDVFKESVSIVPVFYAKIYLEWFPRATGKGLAKNHGTDNSILDQCTLDDKGRPVLPSGNYVAETATYYVINLSANGRRSFIPLSSTQLKASKKWMSLLTAETLETSDGQEFTPPMFYRSWNASVVEQSNPEGDWFGWRFEPGETIMDIDPSGSLLTKCQEYYEQARKGIVQGDVASPDVDGAADLDL